MFKLQVQDDENDARAQLEALYPVLVKMERYAGPKRIRVINIIIDDDEKAWPKR